MFPYDVQTSIRHKSFFCYLTPISVTSYKCTKRYREIIVIVIIITIINIISIVFISIIILLLSLLLLLSLSLFFS